MIHRRLLVAASTFVLTMCICRVAQANSISPYVYFWPGVFTITLVYAFPASLLVSFLERPFLTVAGIRRRPLILSLRANFISTIVGILLIPIGYPALYTIGPLWCVVAFAISCAVELLYLRGYSHQNFVSGWVIGGNAISSMVLMALPVMAIMIDKQNRQLVWFLRPYETMVLCTSLAISVFVFLGSFACRIGSAPELVETDCNTHGATPTHLGLENQTAAITTRQAL